MVYTCYVPVGVHTLTYRRCRDQNATGQYFAVSECSAGKIMSIQSAVVGYSLVYNPYTDPAQCPGNDCTRPTEVPANDCNGWRTCRFLQTLLIYPQGTVHELCDRSKDGNFIEIILTCVPGTTSVVFSVISVIFVHMYTLKQKKYCSTCSRQMFTDC